MRSLLLVINRTELLYLPLLSVFTPIKSIQLFCAVCAVRRRNPDVFPLFTPRISLAVSLLIRAGRFVVVSIAFDINLILGLSVPKSVAALVMCVIPLISITD